MPVTDGRESCNGVPQRLVADGLSHQPDLAEVASSSNAVAPALSTKGAAEEVQNAAGDLGYPWLSLPAAAGFRSLSRTRAHPTLRADQRMLWRRFGQDLFWSFFKGDWNGNCCFHWMEIVVCQAITCLSLVIIAAGNDVILVIAVVSTPVGCRIHGNPEHLLVSLAISDQFTAHPRPAPRPGVADRSAAACTPGSC